MSLARVTFLSILVGIVAQCQPIVSYTQGSVRQVVSAGVVTTTSVLHFFKYLLAIVTVKASQIKSCNGLTEKYIVKQTLKILNVPFGLVIYLWGGHCL